MRRVFFQGWAHSSRVEWETAESEGLLTCVQGSSHSTFKILVSACRPDQGAVCGVTTGLAGTEEDVRAETGGGGACVLQEDGGTTDGRGVWLRSTEQSLTAGAGGWGVSETSLLALLTLQV
ncbi:hypothetical protein HJG60_008414 [Phyllostomus discolor]|uniref:Uncharacterized protein n=1 Tax=Phyllostomus discolor TaxID=89673 RepID=A0A834DM82_9CHIR|nr:hypothetical protein HJG60_008414 [Phyllostomus discolor]